MEPDLSNLPTEDVSPHFPPPKRTLPLSNGQPSRKKPALMQRPQSSIIDVTNFSFARPANQPKGFTLKPMPRLPPHGRTSLEQVGGVESQKQMARREKEVSSKSIANPRQPSLEQYLAERTPCPQPKDHPQTSKIAHKDSNLPITEGASPDNSENANSAKGQEVIDLEAESETALTTQAVANSSIPATVSRDTASRPLQDRDRHVSAVQNHPPPRAPARQRESLRDSKSRRGNRRSALTRQQRSISGNKSGLHQLTEDTLFEMLIGRIRQREENEITAANIQRQMETKILELQEENRDLHHRLETGRLQLQKNEVELNKHQTRLEDWKLKIRKFKQVVDELGHDHDSLKEDNERLNTTAASLEKQKSELFQAIDDAKLQIARAEGRADEQRKEIAEKEQRIALLQQALTAAQDQDDCTKAELISERNRSSTLESYIQNYALTQAKQIGLIKEDQAKLMQDLNARLESIATNATTFKCDILSATKTVFDQCRTSIETLSEKYSEEKLSVQEFTGSTQDVISQINTMATKLTESIETSNKVNVGVSKGVQDSLHAIESHLSADSQLFQQLAECRTSYRWLKGRLGAIEPTLENLNASVKVVLDSETKLARQFGDFGKKLEEAQMPKGNPEFEKQLADRFAENTQLQLGLHKMASEIDSLNQLTSEKDATIQNLQQCLTDAKEKCRAVDNRNQALEIDKTALKGEIELRDQRIRHELTTKHNSSQTQMQAKYEQELRTLKAEKDELEKNTELIMTQMNGVQSALVEAKRLFDDQKTQRESLAQETDQRIEQLTQSCSEHMARVEAQILELQKYQQAEAASCMERNGLQEQLRQAQERIHELEETFVVPSVEEEGPRVPPANIVPFSALKSQLSPLRATSPYGDPADFAMLFMSDELLLATPHHKVNEDKACPSRQEEATTEESKKPLEVTDPAKVFDIPQDNEPPPTRANTKRKAVNFAPHRTESTESQRKGSLNTRVPSTEVQSSTQAENAENATEERPTKVTKHINKWTYSRVQASGIEVQQGQFTAPPTRATRGPQRASPKGLVSASSTSEAVGRSNTRGRGKRCSRGK
ncbi:hypothetical protein PENSUB_1238 [Penicillium subrubescens]|uniref:Uncharacterized protein n=1 Tax=Penicillium subrubescens TaxID=1316194 RepID=A0A1Q5UKY1_9EURO|nr:hypothetical protein PENSUB_1238 [Penicillium subrubescens]